MFRWVRTSDINVTPQTMTIRYGASQAQIGSYYEKYKKLPPISVDENGFIWGGRSYSIYKYAKAHGIKYIPTTD